MQKSGTFQTNVDKGRLHARQHTCHFAKIDVTDQTTLKRSLDMQLLHDTVFHHRDTRFLGGPID